MQSIIDGISKEVSVYLEVGMIIRDLNKNDDYEIKKVEREQILLEHKPFLRAEKKNDIPVGYDELVLAYSVGRFFIAGLSTTVEGGYKHDLDRLKRAVKDTSERVRLEEEREQSQRLAQKKSELEMEKQRVEEERDAILRQKQELEAEKQRLIDENASREKMEQERKKKLSLMKKKSSAMRMRFRLWEKKI